MRKIAHWRTPKRVKTVMAQLLLHSYGVFMCWENKY